jgi:hypothetical protein
MHKEKCPMSQPNLSGVPLLGALCVAAGLVSQEDVEICSALQQTIYSGTPIGQILVLKGYLTQLELARMVAQQQNFRRMFCATLDQSLAPKDDESAPATLTPDPITQSVLPELGTFTAAELDTNPLFGATQ